MLRDFSWELALKNRRRKPPTISLRLDTSLKRASRICLGNILTPRTHIQSHALHTELRHPIARSRSHGILTMCPSSSTFVIPLGPTNPSLIIIAKETLVFRRRGISPLLRLLVPTFSLPHAPVWVTPLPSQQSGMLSYRSRAQRGIFKYLNIKIFCATHKSPQFRYHV